MSKSSSKQLYTQNIEWLKSMNINVDKRKVKRKQQQGQSRMEYMASKQS